jgi:hypothetical protein
MAGLMAAGRGGVEGPGLASGSLLTIGPYCKGGDALKMTDAHLARMKEHPCREITM